MFNFQFIFILVISLTYIYPSSTKETPFLLDKTSLIENSFKKELSNFRNNIEKTKMKIELILEEETKLLKDLEAKLSKMSSGPHGSEFHVSLIKAWRSIVDICLSRRIQTKLPTFSKELFLKDIELSEDYQILKKSIVQFNDQVYVRKNKLIHKQYQLLKVISMFRSDLLDKGQMVAKLLDPDFYEDLLREVKIVPFKAINFLLDRKTEFKEHFKSGLGGVLPLGSSLLALFLNFFLVPIAMVFIFKYSTEYLKVFRHKLLDSKKTSIDNKRRITLVLQIFGPYVPWVLCYFLIVSLESYTSGTLVNELRYILPYFRFFIVYRIFVVFLKGEFRRVVELSDTHTLHEVKSKIERSARLTGLYFLLAFSFIYATETVIGKSYVYRVVSEFVWWGGALLAIIGTTFWREEIIGGISRAYKPRFAKPLSRLLGNRIGQIASFPVFLLLVAKVIAIGIFNFLYNFEFAKKSFARLSRKQIEVAGAKLHDTDIDTLPQDYLDFFYLGVPKETELWIDPTNGDLDKCNKLVNDWFHDNAEEQTLAIYGEKGAGKSSLLLGIVKESKAKVINKGVPPKLVTREDVLSFLSDCLDLGPFEQLKQFVTWDKSAEKTLLMLDNSHNFFLAEIGGFSGYEAFIDFLNLRLENLFVCTTFNIHSWRFLDSVFGRNRHFRNIISISQWKEEDISRLINVRHKKSEFHLKYDPIVFARSSKSYSDEFATAEKRFFRILWEMSEGNPRAAIYYWLSSLRPISTGLKVGLPYDREGNVFGDLQSDTFFVYASVVKHENLNSSEAARSTDLPIGFVKYAFNIGLERDFLDRDKFGRYRVNPAWHNAVVNFLKQRNFLYDE